jgi:hypothetical protein
VLPSVVFTNEISADATLAIVIIETKSDDMNTFFTNIISPKNCVNLEERSLQNINSTKLFYLPKNLRKHTIMLLIFCYKVTLLE